MCYINSNVHLNVDENVCTKQTHALKMNDTGHQLGLFARVYTIAL